LASAFFSEMGPWSANGIERRRNADIVTVEKRRDNAAGRDSVSS